MSFRVASKQEVHDAWDDYVMMVWNFYENDPRGQREVRVMDLKFHGAEYARGIWQAWGGPR